MCGENRGVDSWWIKDPGSSPRVRGKRVDGSRTLLRPGLIPACAGKTRGGHYPPRRGAAHPRVCGENYRSRAGGVKEYGSSPRVRGKRRARRRAARTGGLIPACAGKTTRGCSRRHQRRAHPRACGENAEVRADAWGAGGSSPRVRGKLLEHVAGHGCLRLIPACAGKTHMILHLSNALWAHPRVCGENGPLSGIGRPTQGSSPRVRGKLGAVDARLHALGLIPACAGKTEDELSRAECEGAHPRVCGENGFGACSTGIRRGSSPRVRGKPTHRKSGYPATRLIPACAGKTLHAPWRE